MNSSTINSKISPYITRRKTESQNATIAKHHFADLLTRYRSDCVQEMTFYKGLRRKKSTRLCILINRQALKNRPIPNVDQHISIRLELDKPKCNLNHWYDYYMVITFKFDSVWLYISFVSFPLVERRRRRKHLKKISCLYTLQPRTNKTKQNKTRSFHHQISKFHKTLKIPSLLYISYYKINNISSHMTTPFHYLI